jgi:hypothetical protein
MKEKNDIILFDKVVDLYNSLNITMEQDSEFSMNSLLELHNKIPYKSPVFRTNYYSFVFIKNEKAITQQMNKHLNMTLACYILRTLGI